MHMLLAVDCFLFIYLAGEEIQRGSEQKIDTDAEEEREEGKL